MFPKCKLKKYDLLFFSRNHRNKFPGNHRSRFPWSLLSELSVKRVQFVLIVCEKIFSDWFQFELEFIDLRMATIGSPGSPDRFPYFSIELWGIFCFESFLRSHIVFRLTAKLIFPEILLMTIDQKRGFHNRRYTPNPGNFRGTNGSQLQNFFSHHFRPRWSFCGDNILFSCFETHIFVIFQKTLWNMLVAGVSRSDSGSQGRFPGEPFPASGELFWSLDTTFLIFYGMRKIGSLLS